MAAIPSDSDVVAAESGSSSDSDFYSDFDAGSLITDTTSLRSAIQQHEYENGRRYGKNFKYLFPNDEAEQMRLDFTHQLFRMILDGELHVAPIGSNPQRILDIGCGTGIWAIDMADKFPSAHVVGTDITPIQPVWVPPNLEFQIDDAEGDWTFRENSYDFVHARYMRASISDWPKLYKNALRVLRPGGYIQLAEPDIDVLCDDGTVPENSEMYRYIRLIREATAKIGKPVQDQCKNAKPGLEAAGFEDVQVVTKKVPLNVWAKDKRLKELGGYQLVILLDGIDGICLKLFTNVLGWEVPEVKSFCERLKTEMSNRRYHAYCRYYFTFGRKPG